MQTTHLDLRLDEVKRTILARFESFQATVREEAISDPEFYKDVSLDDLLWDYRCYA